MIRFNMPREFGFPLRPEISPEIPISNNRIIHKPIL